MRASKPEPKVGDLIEIFRPFYKHWAIYVGDGYVVHLAPPSLMVSLPGFQPAEPTAPMLVSKPEGRSLTQSLIHRAAGREVVHHGLPKDSFIINDKEAPEGDAFISLEDSIVLSDGEIAGAGAASIMSTLTEKAVVKKELLDDVVGRDRYRVNNKHDGKYSPLPPSKIVQRAEELVGQELPYSLPCENCEHFVNDLRYGVARSDQVRDAVVVAGITGVGLAAMGLIGVMFSRNKRQTQ